MQAGLAFTIPYLDVIHQETALLAKQVRFIKRPTFIQAGLQPLLNCRHEMVDFTGGQAVDLAQRVNPGEEKDVVNISIADPGNAGLIKQEGFDRPALSRQKMMWIFGGKIQSVRASLPYNFVLHFLAPGSVMSVPEPPEMHAQAGII